MSAALDVGLREIGISSHAPLPFETSWTMPVPRLAEYVRDVRAAAAAFAGRITVLLGAELDFIPDERVLEFQRAEILSRPFDYFVGSVHYLGATYPPRAYDESEERFQSLLTEEYGHDMRAMIEDYYRRVQRMLDTPRLTIVGHLDRIKLWNADGRYFREQEPWYVDIVERTLRAIAVRDVTVELNTKGWSMKLPDPQPSPWILERCAELGIPITVSSDAHRPEDVARWFDRALILLQDLDITPRSPCTSWGTASESQRS